MFLEYDLIFEEMQPHEVMQNLQKQNYDRQYSAQEVR
jgi:hypothetical protein